MKNLRIGHWTGAIAGMMMLGYTASAQTFLPITYVDATDGTDGNTTMIDGSVWEAATSATPGEWLVRGFGNNDTIYENVGNEIGDQGGVEDVHPLRTTVSGRPSDTYDVFVYFWSDTSDNWRIRAALEEGDGDWPLFTPTAEGVVSYLEEPPNNGGVFSDSLGGGNPFTTGDVMLGEGNRLLYQAHLGTVTGTEFSVFLDDNSPAMEESERTWFDGVGYAAVPEPGTYSLFLGLAVIGWLGIRRFRRRS